MNARQPLARKRSPWGEWILSYAGLTLLALLVLMPVLVLLSASLKPPGNVFEYPPRLIPSQFSLENYQGALEKAPLARYLFNTLLVAVGVTLGQLVTSALAAFGFARLNFPAKRALFFGGAGHLHGALGTHPDPQLPDHLQPGTAR